MGDSAAFSAVAERLRRKWRKKHTQWMKALRLIHTVAIQLMAWNAKHGARTACNIQWDLSD